METMEPGGWNGGTTGRSQEERMKEKRDGRMEGSMDGTLYLNTAFIKLCFILFIHGGRFCSFCKLTNCVSYDIPNNAAICKVGLIY